MAHCFLPNRAIRRTGVLWMLLWLLSSHAVASVNVAAADDVIRDYQTFLHGRNPTSINNFGGLGARRDVIELVLLQQALALGGFTQPIGVIREQTYKRTLYRVARGEAIASGGLVWKTDALALQHQLFISDAVIHHGDFVVGLYTAANNKKALNATAQNIRQLRAVSIINWKNDIATLKHLGFSPISLTNTWPSLVRMLLGGRADITLAPFQANKNMAITTRAGQLLPVPHIKVILPGSRHWIVSRRHSQGRAFFNALQKGLAILKKRGTLKRAYRECGFFNSRVADWTLLHPLSHE